LDKKILIVDDQPDERSIMKFFLEIEGFQVFEASDGQEGLDMAAEHTPDVIIMDIAMPVMNGIAATRAIRNDENLTKTPIVCVTGFSDYYGPHVHSAGCNNILRKPVDLEQLKRLVNKYSGRSKMQTQSAEPRVQAKHGLLHKRSL
jgi:CheY-like chemotaxis protein